MSPQSSSRRGLSRPISLLVCASFFLTPAAHVARAQQQAQDDQDVAKAARQERARKAAQKKSAHVYTDDDLKKSEILTDDDRVRVEAKKSDPNAPVRAAVMPSFDTGDSPAPESLGEVARRIRKEVAERQAEEAAKSLSPLFPIEFEQPLFAIPVEPREPVAPMKSLPWKNPRPVAKASHVAPATPALSVRRDPFSPPGSLTPDELAAPTRPRTSFANAAPHAPVARHSSESAAPSLHLAKPAIATPPDNALRVAPVAPTAPAMERRLAVRSRSLIKPHRAGALVAPKLILPTLGAAPPLAPTETPDAPRVTTETRSVVRNTGGSTPVARVSHVTAVPELPRFVGPLMPSAPVLAAPSAPVAPSVPLGVSVPLVPEPRVPVQPPSPKVVLPATPPAPALAPDVAPVRPASVSPVAPQTMPATPIDSANTLVVRGGDSLWKLARRIFGSGNRWNQLVASNPGITNPNHIVPGTVLTVPPMDLRPRAEASNEVAVRFGDSLWKLAAFYLGRGTAWNCIAKANPQVKNVDKIYPGETLTMPDSCGADEGSSAGQR